MIRNNTINQAIDYILAHGNEPISVEDLARHCHFSKFHFSRLFKSETGESVYEFIKRMKMEQSAFRLKVEKGRKITEISSDYGYSSSNYSSAFKQHHNLSPAEFRKSIAKRSMVNPLYETKIYPYKSFEECDSLISIELLPDYPVICERHKGSYLDLSERWGAFLTQYENYITDESLLLECSYDDPLITKKEDCLCDLYIAYPKMHEPSTCSSGVNSPDITPHCITLKGGKFAVYPFNGPVLDLYAAYQDIFQVWLPKSGYSIDSRYGISIYRHVDCDTMDMAIDLCIPIH